MTTMTELLLPRGSTKYKEQVQKFLESQPAVKKDRAGELALGNSFLGLTGRGVVSGLGMQGRLKNRVGGPGPGWNGLGETPQARETGPTWNLQKRNFTSTRVIFLHLFALFLYFFAFPRLGVIFWHFFCISQIGSYFWAFFLYFPNRELVFVFFAFPRPDLPPSPFAWSLWENDKKIIMLESRKRQKNNKKITKK